jgi:hypothetical protein
MDFLILQHCKCSFVVRERDILVLGQAEFVWAIWRLYTGRLQLDWLALGCSFLFFFNLYHIKFRINRLVVIYVCFG